MNVYSTTKNGVSAISVKSHHVLFALLLAMSLGLSVTESQAQSWMSMSANMSGRSNEDAPAGYVENFYNTDSFREVSSAGARLDASWWFYVDTATAALQSAKYQVPYALDRFRIAFEPAFHRDLSWAYMGVPNSATNVKFIQKTWYNGYNYYEMHAYRALLQFLVEYDASFHLENRMSAFEPGVEQMFPPELDLTNFDVQSIAKLASYLETRFNALVKDSELGKKVEFPVSIVVRPMLSFVGSPPYAKGGSAYFFSRKGVVDSGLVYPALSQKSNSMRVYKAPESKYDKEMKFLGAYSVGDFVPAPVSDAQSLLALQQPCGLVISFKGVAPPSFLDELSSYLASREASNKDYANGITRSALGAIVKFRIGKVAVEGIVESALADKYVEVKIVALSPQVAPSGDLWMYNGSKLSNNTKVIVLATDIGMP